MEESFEDIAKKFDNLFGDVEKLTKLEALSIQPILDEYNAKKVLDCACGSGIQSIGLAEKGYDIYASDISNTLLKITQEKAKNKNLKIVTKNVDFKNLEYWKEKFDATICCGNSLPLVSSLDEVKTVLQNMKMVTKHKGIVIIGLHNYNRLKNENQLFLLRKNTENELIFDVRDFSGEKIIINYFFVNKKMLNTETEVFQKSYLYLHPDKIVELMQKVGYSNIRLLGTEGVNKFQDDEWFFVVGEA